MLGKIIADRGRGDASLAHRVTYLIETLGDIAGGIKPGDTRSLVRVNLEAAILGCLGAQHDREFGADQRAERRVDNIKGQSALRHRHVDGVVLYAEAIARSLAKYDAGSA